MKKPTLLLCSLFALGGFAQQKSTGEMQIGNGIPITANFTLNNDTQLVTLVLKGPSDRWFALGMGTNVVSGFGMGEGDVIVYTTTLTDRNYQGAFEPPIDTNQNWNITDNTVSGNVRTLTLTRALTNNDGGENAGQDLQFPYATTNSINIAGVRSLSANDFTVPGGHGGVNNAGFASGTFTPLGVEDFSLNASTIFPNPSNGNFTVKAKTALEKINVYSQTGAFIKTIAIDGGANEADIKLNGLATGVYLIELQNASEKSWKKIIIK